MELQCIPARHGVATYVPAGKQIKIINTSGTQVVDLWAFALPKPEEKKAGTAPEAEESEVSKEDVQRTPAKSTKSQRKSDLPSQEEAERSTREGLAQSESTAEDSSKKGTSWSGYLPSVPSVPAIGFGKKNKTDVEDEQTKNSRTWSSYFAAGKGFSSYIPKQASDTVTQFAGYHARDNNKTYLQQLQDFSKTPVGAAGMAAITGSGYGGSLYAGYSAWNQKSAANANPMEFLSTHHSRASTLHLIPKVNDTLVSNLREPVLTLVEDSSPGVHDTLIAACDPNRYKQLGASDWEKHGSCSENLVLALKELNDRAGLKGAKAIGAQVSVDTCPAPLNLWMNVPFEKDGGLSFGKPRCQPDDFVVFKAERDVVVVMSSCPQDLTEISNGEIKDCHFVVQDPDSPTQAQKKAQPKKKPMQRNISPSQTSTAAGASDTKRSGESTVPNASRKKSAASSQDTLPAQASHAAKATPSQQSRKESVQPQAANSSEASQPRKKPNGESAAPVERKKPRKLAVRSQAASGD